MNILSTQEYNQLYAQISAAILSFIQSLGNNGNKERNIPTAPIEDKSIVQKANKIYNIGKIEGDKTSFS